MSSSFQKSSIATPVSVANGGTGLATLTDKNVIIGAGTSNVTFVAPSTSGNVLTSDGTNWTSAAPSSGTNCLTITPLPNFPESHITAVDGASNDTYNTTTQQLGQVVITRPIVANKISFWVNTRNATGTHDLTLYSEDGQTQIFSVTTAAISGSGTMCTTALSSVSIPAGVYWIGINSNSTASINFPVYRASDSIANGVTSEPVLCGRLTITSGTPAATFTPSSLTYDNISTLQFRLDN